jgi:hypothetical protein
MPSMRSVRERCVAQTACGLPAGAIVIMVTIAPGGHSARGAPRCHEA